MSSKNTTRWSRRSACIAAATVLVAMLGTACKKPEAAPAAPDPAPVAKSAPPAPVAAATPAFAVGDAVDVNWNGSWWKAEVLAVKGSTYRIHYVGWGSSWDDDVASDRVRAQTIDSSVGSETPAKEKEAAAAASAAKPSAVVAAKPAATPAAPAAPAFKPGERVDVSWNGQWWQGQVLGVNNGQYRVHYLGWASSWDETVPGSRVRSATSGAKRGSGP